MITITPENARLGATVTGVDLHQSLDESTVEAGVRVAHSYAKKGVLPCGQAVGCEQIRFGPRVRLLQVHRSTRAGGQSRIGSPSTLTQATTAEGGHDVTCAAPKRAQVADVSPRNGRRKTLASMMRLRRARHGNETAYRRPHALHRSGGNRRRELLR